MPDYTCPVWTLELVVLTALANFMIGTAYMVIPIQLYKLGKKAKLKNIAPNAHRMIVYFVSFIFLCGLTHYMKIYSIWNPERWYPMWLAMLTGIVSIYVAIKIPAFIVSFLSRPTIQEYTEKTNEIKSLLEELAFIKASKKQLENTKDNGK